MCSKGFYTTMVQKVTVTTWVLLGKAPPLVLEVWTSLLVPLSQSHSLILLLPCIQLLLTPSCLVVVRNSSLTHDLEQTKAKTKQTNRIFMLFLCFNLLHLHCAISAFFFNYLSSSCSLKLMLIRVGDNEKKKRRNRKKRKM